MHPQYRFIPFRSVNYATLHSSSIMSAALSVFSGCSFAQPSGLAPLSLCPKSRYTAKKRRLFFIFSPPFHAAIPSLHFAKKLRFVLGLAWLFDCRNTATSLLKKNNFR
jgi:hypothetical protein